MGRISSTIGLSTGIPIVDTVDKLIAFEARPRDLLLERNATLNARQVAFSELTARLLTFQFHIKRLASVEVFEKKLATSSDSGLLSARLTDAAIPGSYKYTPIQLAQTQQLISSTFVADDAPLDVGAFPSVTAVPSTRGSTWACSMAGKGSNEAGFG